MHGSLISTAGLVAVTTAELKGYVCSLKKMSLFSVGTTHSSCNCFEQGLKEVIQL
jgi:hypothetical protein